jgi:hypothetical protein
MKRAAIHDVCLHAKMFAPENMSVKTFLGMAPEPPDPEAIDNSFAFLQQLGALFAFSNASPFDPDVEPPSYSKFRKDVEPDITELGSIIAQLPLEPQLARMLVFGIALQCFNPIVTLVAALSHRDPFILPLGEERTIALNARDALGKQDLSDHLMLIRAYFAYTDPTTRFREVCHKYYLSAPTMRMIDGIRRQLMFELRRLKLISQNVRFPDDSTVNKYSNSWPMVQAAIVAGCYPGIGITRSGSKIKKIRTSNENATGLHPSSIVKRQLQLSGRRDTYFADASEPVLEFMAFQELSRIDEGTTLRTVTATTPLHTILFAGSIRIEKIAVQEFEICSEEFIEENVESEQNDYQRDYTVEVDNFLGFRGYFETVQLAMKLRFKFMNYFMKWLRNPTEYLSSEDSQLLECLNNVLTIELKYFNFKDVVDLPESKTYETRQIIQPPPPPPPPTTTTTTTYNGNSRSVHQENGHENGGGNNYAIKKQSETFEPTRKQRSLVIERTNPMVKSCFKAVAAAAAQDTVVNEVATNDLKSIVRNMQQNSFKVQSTQKDNAQKLKKLSSSANEGIKPSVPQPSPASADKSCTTISSSINTQKSTTVIVPPSKPQTTTAAINGEKINGTNLNSTALINLPPFASKAYSNDVRNTGLDAPRYSRTNRYYENSPYRNGLNNSSSNSSQQPQAQQQQNGNNHFNGSGNGGGRRQFFNSNFNRHSNASSKVRNGENKSSNRSGYSNSNGAENGHNSSTSSTTSSSKPQKFSSSSSSSRK